MTSQPFTLRSAAGLPAEPQPLADSTLIIIDAQREYVAGPLVLEGVDDAVSNIVALLAAARAGKAPIIHIAHLGATGGLFDPEVGGRFIEAVEPEAREVVVKKGLPNAFAGTSLQAELQKAPGRQLVIVGFMTHMCVSATARAALDLGYNSVVVSDATATRSLPAADTGDDVAAETVHRASLAALADRFAIVASTERVLA